MADNVTKLHDPQPSNPNPGGAPTGDARYRAWLARHMEACDEDYAAFCRDNPEGANADQEVFDREFESWIRSRRDRNARAARTSATNPTTTGGASGL